MTLTKAIGVHALTTVFRVVWSTSSKVVGIKTTGVTKFVVVFD